MNILALFIVAVVDGGSDSTELVSVAESQKKQKAANKGKKVQNSGVPKSIARKEREQNKLFNAAAKIATADDDDDDDWVVDLSEEAVLARRKLALQGNLGNIAAGSTSESALRNEFYAILTSSSSNDEKICQINHIKSREQFGDERICVLLFDASFDKNIATKITAQLGRCKDIYPTYGGCTGSQKSILGKLESLVVRHNLQSAWKDILFAFYDCDVLEEDAILSWYDVPSTEFISEEQSEKLRTEAEPFINWLGEDDEEEEEEEEENE